LRKLDAINEDVVFKASFKVTENPEHVIAIFEHALYKIKIKPDKLGSVKRAFNYINIKLVEKTSKSVVIHILQRDPSNGERVV
jgi:hypothetical protein